MNGAVVWLIIAIALFVLEGATVQFLSIWFAIGAVAGMIASIFGAPFWLQLVLFLLTSIVVLITARPIIKDKFTPQRVATNVDMVIGQTGYVIEEIDNIKQTGRVRVAGLDWAAVAQSGEVLPVDINVTILKIEGVKLIVKEMQPA